MTPSTPKQIPLPLGLQNEPSFTNFISGPNREAATAVEGLAGGVGERVLYLWGEHGTGKSHLLRAACQRATQQDRAAIYLSCRMPDLIEKNRDEYAHAALVCIDDIDALAGNREKETAIFHLYNLLETKGGGLLVAGVKTPTRAGFSLRDLGSRLTAALILRLHPLDEDGKRRALQCRAREIGFTLSDEVINFLLRRCNRNMPSLFSLLDRIDEATLVEKRRATIPFVRELLEQM